MVLHYDDPSFEDQGGRFQAHFVLEIRSLFRLILYWTILSVDEILLINYYGQAFPQLIDPFPLNETIGVGKFVF